MVGESRFEDMESRIAFQEDLLQKLDDALGLQQQQIFELKEDIRRLNAIIADLESALPTPEDTPPPHY
ncbi:MAG: SlyX family protein [Pseudomonadota bacterium]